MRFRGPEGLRDRYGEGQVRSTVKATDIDPAQLPG